MLARFTVLASGSSGNASVLEVDGFGLLIDCGLGPRVLAQRLAYVGLSWRSISAVLLTHTHSDHWNALTLGHLRALNVPVVAHPCHHGVMAARDEYSPLRRAGLTREYAEDRWFDVTPALACRPVRVPHDSDPTFAFRFEARDGSAGWSLGFASDVGHVTPALADALCGVDVLALEYNHDVRMQRASGRPRLLIERVLGDHGHLSNVQAAELTRTVARSAGADGLRCVVQLHLSRDCNRPEIAAKAGRAVLQADAPSAELFTASQHTPTPPLPLIPRPAARRAVREPSASVRAVQPTLPGLGDEPAASEPR